ncbi:hypothetical protein [Pseudoduganella sp. OTU4001]|uniref:hypothetical protein n=1 Tax=Pseudoduganella sp. OTU4001 TaxID=3043854 RepID=UPI00313B610A
MTRASTTSTSLDNVVTRAEESDPELRQRRIALDEAGLQLKQCAPDMKPLALQDYRAALRNLLHYLSTSYIN